VALLHEHGPEAERRRVTLHDEQLVEVGHGEDRGCRDGRFEGRECCCGGLIPAEAIFLEKCREGGGHGAIVMHELAVVPREPEETANRPHRARCRPVVDGLDDLGRVHGDPLRRYDVAEVGDGGCSKGTLGALDEELVSAKLVEDCSEVA
jgi:hypothetical protein